MVKKTASEFQKRYVSNQLYNFERGRGEKTKEDVKIIMTSR